MIVKLNQSIQNREEIIKEITPLLNPHPLIKGNFPVNGIVINCNYGNLKQKLDGYPLLYQLLSPFILQNIQEYVFAINQTPPTEFDSFFMLPHFDSYYQENGSFQNIHPLNTFIFYLNFPSDSKGGELIIFNTPHSNSSIKKLQLITRKQARSQLENYPATFHLPSPGVIYQVHGNVPHAVLGYTTNDKKSKRLAFILASYDL